MGDTQRLFVADEADEYAVELSTGRIFYTGGWESIGSLRAHIDHGADIAGSYEQGAAEWFRTYINRAQVVAIVDARESA